MRLAIDEGKKRKIIIEKVRKELIEVLGKQDKVVKLEGFSTEELNELLFNSVEEGDTKKKIFALPNSILQKIDMSNVSFNDFYAKNIDFGQFTGVRIDPNKLYNKSCFYTSFAGVTFLNGFRSGYIEGCNFTGSKNAVIGDRIKTRLNRCNGVLEAENSSIGKDVALGEKNVFKDVTFESPITKGNIVSSDFTGSKDAVIELGPDRISSIVDCRLKDATLKGNLIDCIIQGTDFRGANIDNGKIELYPDKLGVGSIYESDVIDFSDCHFAGVKFMRPIGGKNVYKIKGADFTGSEGVIIHPSVISKYDYSNCKLAGVSFIPGTSISDANLNGTDFTGSVGAVISSSQRSIVDANLTDASVKFIDPDDFFAIPGINSATYNGKKFKTVFKETISKDFDDSIKTYTKKINAAIVKASE